MNAELIISHLAVTRRRSMPPGSSSLILSHPIVVPLCSYARHTQYRTRETVKYDRTYRSPNNSRTAVCTALPRRDEADRTRRILYCTATDEQGEKGAIAPSYDALDMPATSKLSRRRDLKQWREFDHEFHASSVAATLYLLLSVAICIPFVFRMINSAHSRFVADRILYG